MSDATRVKSSVKCTSKLSHHWTLVSNTKLDSYMFAFEQSI